MSKKIKVEFTETQFKSFINCIDNISATTGTIDEDYNKTIEKDVKLVDRALKKAGYKRDFN